MNNIRFAILCIMAGLIFEYHMADLNLLFPDEFILVRGSCTLGGIGAALLYTQINEIEFW